MSTFTNAVTVSYRVCYILKSDKDTIYYWENPSVLIMDRRVAEQLAIDLRKDADHVMKAWVSLYHDP